MRWYSAIESLSSTSAIFHPPIISWTCRTTSARTLWHAPRHRHASRGTVLNYWYNTGNNAACFCIGLSSAGGGRAVRAPCDPRPRSAVVTGTGPVERALVNWWFYGRRVHHRLMNSLRRQRALYKRHRVQRTACPWCGKILTRGKRQNKIIISTYYVSIFY
jgi:hypothetical protein